MALTLEQTKEYIAQQFLHVPEIIHRFNKIAVILKQDKEAALPPHLLNFILHGGSNADPTPQTSDSNNTTTPQTPPQPAPQTPTQVPPPPPPPPLATKQRQPIPATASYLSDKGIVYKQFTKGFIDTLMQLEELKQTEKKIKRDYDHLLPNITMNMLKKDQKEIAAVSINRLGGTQNVQLHIKKPSFFNERPLYRYKIDKTNFQKLVNEQIGTEKKRRVNELLLTQIFGKLAFKTNSSDNSTPTVKFESLDYFDSRRLNSSQPL